MKKWISAILAAIIAVAMTASGIPVFAETATPTQLGQSGVTIEPFGIIDVTPPVLTGITLDKTTVETPGIVTVTATATDDISGVSGISIDFYCEESQQGIYANLSNEVYNEETDEYEIVDYFTGRMRIDEYTLSGVYFCESINVYDRAGNRAEYRRNLDDWMIENGYFPLPEISNVVVINNSSIAQNETMPPVLTSVDIPNTILNAPGSLAISATATDDSGVSHIFIDFYCESANRSLYTSLNDEIYNEDTEEYENTGIFKGKARADKYQIPGEYICTNITVVDIFGNRQEYTKDPDEWQLEYGYLPIPFNIPSITIINSNPIDTMPPELTSLSLSRTTMDTPDTIKITATATDDVSGVSGISVDFYSEDFKSALYASLFDEVYNELTGEYERTGIFKGYLRTSLYQLPGVYKCVNIRVYDEAGNRQEYVSDLEDWMSDYGYLPFPLEIPSITVINNNNCNPEPEPPTDPTIPTYPTAPSTSSGSSSKSGSSSTYKYEKRDVSASATVSGNEITIKGQTRLGFMQVTYMGKVIEGVKTRTVDGGVVIILPDDFMNSKKNPNFKVRIEFFNAYVNVDVGAIK